MNKKTYLKISVGFFVVAAVLATTAEAELRLEDGFWRLETTAATGVHSGSTSREGDQLYSVTVDYEIPVSARGTLGLRLIPLFIYDQEAHDSDPDLIEHGFEDDDSMVWGGGLGLTLRLYSVRDEYRGWYVEGESSLLVHDEYIAGNNSHVNFLLGVGAGYQFKNNWHATLKYIHISNSSLTRYNAGANSVGLGLGYRF